MVDPVGRLMDFPNFKRPMGRIWTLLYLAPEPLGAAEVGEALRMSAGAVSMAIGELVKWGAVKKSWRPGERRDFYEAETSVGRLVQRVLRERELALVRGFGEALEAAQRALPNDRATKPGTFAFKRERLSELRRPARASAKRCSPRSSRAKPWTPLRFSRCTVAHDGGIGRARGSGLGADVRRHRRSL